MSCPYGAGKTIMTTEPKFVPNEAVELVLNDILGLSYGGLCWLLGPGGPRTYEDEVPRMASTLE